MAATAEEKTTKASKTRTLNLIRSLNEDDDERTSISKRVSWILRHGSKSVGVNLDLDGYIKVSDLAKIDILDDVSEEKLNQVIVDSNGRKLRYEITQGTDGMSIRAYREKERKAKDIQVGGDRPEKPERKERPGKERKERPKKEEAKDKGLRSEAKIFVPEGTPTVPPTMPPTAPTPKASPTAGATPTAAQVAAQAAAYATAMQWQMAMYPQMMGNFLWSGPYGQDIRMDIHGAVGRIKSFNADKGFGFIECPYTYAQYNRDVFLHKAQIGDLRVGQIVTFKCEINKQGMPQASNLVATSGPLGLAPPPPPSKGKGKGKKGKEGGKEGKGKKSKEGKGKKATEPKEKQEKTEGGDAAPKEEEAAKETGGGEEAPTPAKKEGGSGEGAAKEGDAGAA
jgi:cold shock CspA family protein